MPITLKQVEAFHAVMSTGGVTRAAEKLGVSQPAISRIVGDFEAAVGFPLFLRASRNLVPTARARLLHAEVERTFLGLGHIETIAAGLARRGEGQLRLTIVPSLLPMVSEGLIARFAAQHPEASISIEVTPTLNTIDWATSRQADIGITAETITAPGVETRVIGRTEAVCVVPRGHRLTALTRPVHARDLEGAAFISYKPDATFRAEVDRLFIAEGIGRDLRVEARTTAAICELVTALDGVAIVPSPGPHLAADQRLAVLAFRPRLVSDVVLVVPTGSAPLPLVRAFVDLATDKPMDFLRSLRRGAPRVRATDRG